MVCKVLFSSHKIYLHFTELVNQTQLVLTWAKIPCLGQSESEVAQSCPTLCDPMDCSLSGSSVHGILQAGILECVAMPFSRRSS